MHISLTCLARHLGRQPHVLHRQLATLGIRAVSERGTVTFYSFSDVLTWLDGIKKKGCAAHRRNRRRRCHGSGLKFLPPKL